MILGRRGEKASSIAFRDIMLALNAMLAATLLFVLPNINPASDDVSVKSPGNMMVAVGWPAGDSDVDLWVTGPGQELATGYPAGRKSGVLWDLLRDDLGNVNDPMPVNFENAFSRGQPAGEYIVNVHCYGCKAEVPVRVEVRLSGGSLLTEETVLLRPEQEKTVIRFKLDEAGKIVPGSVNKVYAKLRTESKPAAAGVGGQ